MGVLKGTKVTLMNQNIKNIEKIFENEYISSILIKDLEGVDTSKHAMGWSTDSDDFISAKTYGAVRKIWTEEKDIYLLINNKLKVSLDQVILFKDDEGIITWDHSKSLRKGYFLFTHDYKFEVIKSIKKIRNKGVFYSISVSGCPYFFGSDYLLHNARECEMCDLCYFFRKMVSTNYEVGSFNNGHQYWPGSNLGTGTLHFHNNIFSQNTYSWVHPTDMTNSGITTGLNKDMNPIDSYGGSYASSTLQHIILHETIPGYTGEGLYSSVWSDRAVRPDSSNWTGVTDYDYKKSTSTYTGQSTNGGLSAYNNWCQSIIFRPWHHTNSVGDPTSGYKWTSNNLPSDPNIYFYKRWYHNTGRLGFEFVVGNESTAKSRVNVPTYLMDIPYRFNHPNDGTENPAGTPTNPVKKPEDAPPRDSSYQYSGYTPSSQFKIAFARHGDMNASLTLIQGNSGDGWVTYVKSKSANDPNGNSGFLYPPNSTASGNVVPPERTYWIFKFPINGGGTTGTRCLWRTLFNPSTTGDVANQTTGATSSGTHFISNAMWSAWFVPYG